MSNPETDFSMEEVFRISPQEGRVLLAVRGGPGPGTGTQWTLSLEEVQWLIRELAFNCRLADPESADRQRALAAAAADVAAMLAADPRFQPVPELQEP